MKTNKQLTKEQKDKIKTYSKEYYKQHREEILDKSRIKYFNTRKKTPKCRMCGKQLPKYLTAHTKYCEKCLYSKGHGKDAHRMAAVRHYRKNHLTNREITGKI